jgi:colanic acid biosynthesis glycosyl transferase WcaI
MDKMHLAKQNGESCLAPLWIVSEVYFPEETSTGHYLTLIAEGLAKERSISVICAKPNYSKRGVEVARKEVRNGVKIFRCRSTSLDKNGYIFRITNVVTVTLSIFALMIRYVRDRDIVLVGTNPPILPFAAAFACFIKRARCVLKIEDLYPDNMIAAGMIARNGAAAWVMNTAQRQLFVRVNAICVLGRDMANLVRRKAAPARPKVEWIPNWADSDVIRPEARGSNRMIRELGLGGKFVIGYAGNIGPLQGIDHLFDCIARLSEYAEVHFIFVGTGKKYGYLERSIRDAGLKNVTLIGQKPRSEQLDFLNACDIALVSLNSGMSGVGVPSRTYNYLAAGKPVLAAVDADSEIATLVNEENVGWVVSPGQVDAFVAAALAAKSDPERLAQMGRRARVLAESIYSFEHVLMQYRTVLKSWSEC